MKTLILLLLVAAGLGAAYWKTQHPDATLDDVKLGANNTLERAKAGFETFRSGEDSGDALATADSSDATDDANSGDASADNNDASGNTSAATAAVAAAGAAAGAAVAAATNAGTSELNQGLLDTTAANDRSGADVISAEATVINGRLTDAERRMDATDQKLDSIEDSLASLTEELETVSSSLGNLNDNVAGLSTDLTEQDDEQTLTNIGTRIDSIDSQLNALSESNEASLESLTTQTDSTIEELRTELLGLTEANSSLQSRINTLSVDASGDGDGALSAQVDQRLQELETKLGTANSDKLRLNNLVARLNSTNQQIEALSASQEGAGGNNEQVNELVAALEATTKKTENLEAQLSQANDKIASMSEELEVLKSQGGSASVESLQAELTQQLEELEARIADTDDDTTNNDINTLNSTLASTRQRIQLLESRVQGLPTDGDNAAAVQAAQSELQSQIAAMEERLRALPQQTDPELISTLNQVQQDVAELRDRENANGIEYRVYFGNGSTVISDDAAVVLKSFIKQEQNRTTGVNIYGFTDRRGDAQFNQRLALQRATAVRSYLIQNGFDFTKIKSLSGLGEDAAAATLDDGAEDADQRTVVLVADQP